MNSPSNRGVDVLIVGPLACPVYGPLDGVCVPWPTTCPNPDFVIAVDSGLDRCLERGWDADVVVGDFDSVSREGLDHAVDQGVQLVRLPVDKDRSDLDVALDIAAERGATLVTIVGMMGGRLDHQLAVLGALAGPHRASILSLGPLSDAGQPVVEDVMYILEAGDFAAVSPLRTFSVIGLTGPARVSVSGARWPLVHQAIAPLSSLGLSNQSLEAGATVVCDSGVVAVIVPPELM